MTFEAYHLSQATAQEWVLWLLKKCERVIKGRDKAFKTFINDEAFYYGLEWRAGLVNIFDKLYSFYFTISSPLSSMMKIHSAMYKPAKRQISHNSGVKTETDS